MFLVYFSCPANHVPDWQPSILLGYGLSSHQKVVFRCQKRQIFDVKKSTYFTVYVGHSTRQAIFILGVSNANNARRTATHFTTASFSTTTDSDITTVML